MAKIPCQAVECAEAIPSARFMCRDHWYALPKPLRDQVNACWRDRQRAIKAHGLRGAAKAILAHVEATDEAIRLTAEREGHTAGFKPRAPGLRKLYVAADGDD